MFLSVLHPGEAMPHQTQALMARWPEGSCCGRFEGQVASCSTRHPSALRVLKAEASRGLLPPQNVPETAYYISSCLSPSLMGMTAPTSPPGHLSSHPLVGLPPPRGNHWSEPATASWSGGEHQHPEAAAAMALPTCLRPVEPGTDHSFSTPRDAKGMPLPE